MTEKGKYRVCGALAGTVNGLFGGGGGIPLAFLLRSWAKLSDKTALATCVAVIFPFCLVSVLVYAFRGALPLGEALPYLVGGLAGGWIGGRLFKDVPNTWLKRIFALFLLYGAVRYSVTGWLFPALCGLLTGILSSWGVGGGTLLLLCMTLFFGVEQRTAQAINLLYFLPTAGISLFAHRKNGYLDKAVLRAAIPTGTLCALAAAFLTTMVDSSVFRKPFGLFLLYAGLSILFEKKKNSKKETP